MPEFITDIEQGSPRWFLNRLASIGGSGITTVASTGTTRKQFLYEMTGEYLTGVPSESKTFQYAERGHIYESVARDRYAYKYGVQIDQFGIIKDGPHKHYSPDGIRADSNVLIEIKVRIPKTYIEFLDTGAIPTSDRRQCQWGIKRGEFDRCDYIQFCPEMKHNSTTVIEIKPDKKEIDFLENSANQFIAEMRVLAERIKNGR